MCKNWSHDENGNSISKIYAINTGGIFMTNPRKQHPNKKDAKFDISHIGKTFQTDSPATYFENTIGKTSIQIIIQIRWEMEQFIMVVPAVVKLIDSVKWHQKPKIQSSCRLPIKPYKI